MNKDFRSRDATIGLLLVIPAVAWVALAVITPLLSGVQTSLTSQRVVGSEFEFVGLQQYAELLRDELFIASLGRSVVWILGNGILQTVVALIVALLINRPFRGQNFVRSWLILPWVVPTAVTAILWRWMFDATAGVFNALLMQLEVLEKPILFLANPDIAARSLTFVNSWRLFPFLTIVFLASLASVPQEEYEAARVDGANAFMQFRAIAFPRLMPTLTVLGLVGTLWASNVFDLIWMMTRGGPGVATTTVPVLMYDTAFYGYDIARAAAGSLVFLVLLTVYAALFVVLNRKQFAAADQAFEKLAKQT